MSAFTIGFRCVFFFAINYGMGVAQTSGLQDYVIHSTYNKETLRDQIQQTFKLSVDEIDVKTIFGEDIHKVRITDNSSRISLSELEQIRGVLACSHDVKVEGRRIPNDPDFNLQVGLQIIECEKAWDFSVGGQSLDGRQIVIAVMDDGFDMSHEDIRENLWTNDREIPGNGIDDDDNGYIDDYFGLNTKLGNDEHVLKSHGTGVAGIVGARGDNGIGISGVAWEAKLLLISGITQVSDIIEANGYILQQRRLYNATNGREGAFIIASNYSGGIPGAFESDQPILCQTYDALGSVGLISVASSSNRSEDIDVVGDIPAHCSSEHIIIVTNTAVDTDELFHNAGIGTNTIDIGAPGQGSYTTRNDNQYDHFGGTSASSPHVTGAVALLYGAACEDFYEMVDHNPSEAALEIKQTIMDNVDKKSSLEGITVSEGRLNAFQSITGLRKFCGLEATELNFTFKSPVSFTDPFDIQLTSPFLLSHELLIHNIKGKLVYTTTIAPPLFGSRTIQLDSKILGTGIYFLTIMNREARKTVKFFVYN